MLSLSNTESEVGVYAVDPDLHFMSLVGLNERKEVIAVGQTNVPKSKTGDACIQALCEELADTQLGKPCSFVPMKCFLIIEDQQQYSAKNKESLIKLSRASGIAAMAYTKLLEPQRSWFVRPHTWKGNVPDDIMRARTVKASGLRAEQRGYNWLVEWPEPHQWAREIPAGRQCHLIAALGIALYALKTDSEVIAGSSS